MTSQTKSRIDKLLVEMGLVRSRHQAQECIEQGIVLININGTFQKVLKSNQRAIPSQISLIKNDWTRFVSRGGLKMERALNFLNLDVKNLKVLDVGISTGGFSDCLLQKGAAHIVGIDVGRGQLAERIKNEKRVTHFEKLDIRRVDAVFLKEKGVEPHFDLIVVDLSFISVFKVLKSLIPLLTPKGMFLILIKPQFEVGPQNLNKNGIVKNKKLYEKIRDKSLNHCFNLNLKVLNYFPCAIEGRDGNQEYFLLACTSPIK